MTDPSRITTRQGAARHETTKPVAIFTAAGSGMGAAAVRLFAERGWDVAVLSSSGAGEALAHELGGVGITGDNRTEADLVALVDGAMERWGRIDAVVNSAGHGPSGDLLALSDEDWHAGLDTYLLNVVRIARLVTPILIRGGGGSIVNVSTFAAVEPDPAFPTSAVVRAGLSAFTKLFADRYAPERVRMNDVLPGFVDTFPERPESRARIPMGRYAHAGEVAEAVLYLASPGSSYVTGQAIRVDGGLTRSI